MPDVEINELSKHGLVRDQEGYQLPPEAFTTADNMRFVDEGVERIGGRTQVFGTLPEAPHFLMPIQSPFQTFWIWLGGGTGGTHPYVYDGANHTYITGAFSTTNTRDWNGVLFSSIPIINNGTEVPYYWPGFSLASPITALNNWPGTYRCKIMRSIGPHLVALGITKGGTVYPHMVKWSHPADPGSLPITWDPTLPQYDAGEIDLPDVNSGIIQDGLPLRGQLFIYKNNSVWRMRFVGGQDVFAFDTLLETAGLLTARCATVTSDGQKHVFATQDDILIHNGTTAESILDKRMKKTLVNAMDAITYINSFMFTDPHRNECWFCYPEAGRTHPNRAIVFNSRNGSLSESGVNFRNAAVGVVEIPTPILWPAATGPWDAFVDPWAKNTRRKVIVAATDSSKFLELDAGVTNDGATFTGTLQRVGLGILGKKRSGEPIVDFTKHKVIKRVWIKGSGGPINIRVGFQRLPDGAVTWTLAKPFDPATQKYIDVVGSGKAVSIEFSASTEYRISGYKLEMMPLGRF